MSALDSEANRQTLIAWCETCGDLEAGEGSPDWALNHFKDEGHRTAWQAPI